MLIRPRAAGTDLEFVTFIKVKSNFVNTVTLGNKTLSYLILKAPSCIVKNGACYSTVTKNVPSCGTSCYFKREIRRVSYGNGLCFVVVCKCVSTVSTCCEVTASLSCNLCSRTFCKHIALNVDRKTGKNTVNILVCYEHKLVICIHLYGKNIFAVSVLLKKMLISCGVSPISNLAALNCESINNYFLLFTFCSVAVAYPSDSILGFVFVNSESESIVTSYENFNITISLEVFAGLYHKAKVTCVCPRAVRTNLESIAYIEVEGKLVNTVALIYKALSCLILKAPSCIVKNRTCYATITKDVPSGRTSYCFKREFGRIRNRNLFCLGIECKCVSTVSTCCEVATSFSLNLSCRAFSKHIALDILCKTYECAVNHFIANEHKLIVCIKLDGKSELTVSALSHKVLSISRVSPICYLAALDCIISNLVLGGRTCGITVSDDSELVIIGFGIGNERKCVVTILNDVDVLVSTKTTCGFHILGTRHNVRGCCTSTFCAIRKSTIFKENGKLEFVTYIKVKSKLVNVACSCLLCKMIIVKIGAPTVNRTGKYPVTIILIIRRLPLCISLCIFGHNCGEIKCLGRGGSYEPTGEDITFLGGISRFCGCLTLFNLNCVKDGSTVVVIKSECVFFCLCLEEEARC